MVLEHSPSILVTYYKFTQAYPPQPWAKGYGSGLQDPTLMPTHTGTVTEFHKIAETCQGNSEWKRQLHYLPAGFSNNRGQETFAKSKVFSLSEFFIYA
jgi:hypothetical protein